ncbi:MAG TPA: NAD(P)-dependent oxidoreductase, partial [Polyangiaceae bacterium]|nr:NAD(P)-dependent oxidoreductase [Polyangiaceae bacterium]
PTSPGAERSFTPEQLGEALALADHVVSLLPGDASTQGFFGASAFSKMKPSAYFYNLGRGSTVDEAALVTALGNGTIAGAFLDVTAEEPLRPESVLWRTENLYITPHSSAIAAQYLDLYFDELAPMLRAAAKGTPSIAP